MTDNEFRDSWNFSKMVAIKIGSVTLSLEDVLAIDDFINHQKAEIERLTAQNGVYETCNSRKQEAINSLENSLAISKKETKRYVENYKRQKEEIEEYRNIIERATEGIREVKAMLPRELAKERAKAVKEYAKILKTKVYIDLCSAIDCSDYLTDDLPKIIDNLVKEFTDGKQE